MSPSHAVTTSHAPRPRGLRWCFVAATALGACVWYPANPLSEARDAGRVTDLGGGVIDLGPVDTGPPPVDRGNNCPRGCPPGWMCCANTCVPNSEQNCGACERQCTPGQRCEEGRCVGTPAGGLITGLGGPAGFGPAAQCLEPNDDGGADPDAGFYVPPVDLLGFFTTGLHYYGRRYTQLFVNTNGNVSFGTSFFNYTPVELAMLPAAMIAPWWGDVDTRGGGQPGRNMICWALSTDRLVVTWFDVGYYQRRVDRLNAFQLVLSPRREAAQGDFDVEFRYARCEWTTGEAMGGIGGECPANTPMCVNAAVGFAGGPSREGMELPNSRTPQVVQVCRGTNAGIPGVWRYRVRNGVVSQ